MLFGNVMITDSEGREVPLAPHLSMTGMTGMDSVTGMTGMTSTTGSRERRRRLRAAGSDVSGPPTRQEWRRMIGYGLAHIPLLILLGIAPAVMTFKLHWPVWAVVLAVLPLGLAPAVLTVWIGRRVAKERIARMMLRAGYCPSCSHDLTGVTANDRARRVCPECGAAWAPPDNRNTEQNTIL